MSEIRFLDEPQAPQRWFYEHYPQALNRQKRDCLIHECPMCAKENQDKVVTITNGLLTIPRQHKRRRNQSLSYHNRIQKKWNKRAYAMHEAFIAKQDVVQVPLPQKLIEALTQR